MEQGANELFFLYDPSTGRPSAYNPTHSLEKPPCFSAAFSVVELEFRCQGFEEAPNSEEGGGSAEAANGVGNGLGVELEDRTFPVVELEPVCEGVEEAPNSEKAGGGAEAANVGNALVVELEDRKWLKGWLCSVRGCPNGCPNACPSTAEVSGFSLETGSACLLASLPTGSASLPLPKSSG